MADNKRLSHKWSLLIIFSIAFVATTTPQVADQSTRVAAGNVVLILPAINGFRFPTVQERGIYDDVAQFILPKNRLLAALFTDGDLQLFTRGYVPHYDEYFVIQIPRSIESRTVTFDEFQILRRDLRKQQQKAQFQVSPAVKRQLANASKNMSDNVGAKVTISLNEAIPLDVFVDTEHSIGLAFLTRFGVEANELQTEELGLSASVTTVIRGKLLYLTGARTFHSMNDLSRCTSQIEAWLSKLHTTNP